MHRTHTPEIMDDPNVPRADLAESLAYLRGVNRRLGGSRALIRLLEGWSSRWRRGETITLLDVATGSADIPVAARRWALVRGFDLRITGIDAHALTLELAREHLSRVAESEPEVARGIRLVRADALRLVEEFGGDSFDYAHAALFLHHLSDIEVATVLRIMDRVSRRGIVWSDLVRSRFIWWMTRVATLGQPHIIRFDARVSIEKGFTKREVLAYARRLDLGYTRYRRDGLLYRFTLSGEKPWSAMMSDGARSLVGGAAS